MTFLTRNAYAFPSFLRKALYYTPTSSGFRRDSVTRNTLVGKLGYSEFDGGKVIPQKLLA